MSRCVESIAHIDFWFLTCDFLEALLRLLSIIHDNVEVSLQVAPQTRLIKDGKVRAALASFSHIVCLAGIEAQYALAANNLL